MTGRHYILTEQGEPVAEPDLLKWASWFEEADRHLAKTDVGDAHVSTVFLGVDHSFGGDVPLVFETIIFGGAFDGDMERYGSRKKALEGHEAAVRRLRANLQ